jgi:methyl-accepting chemotaxis protein
VNTAVSQLDQMTQQNAALVEESAAAAESLKGQAARLLQVIQVFRISDQAVAAPAPTPPLVKPRIAAPQPAPRLQAPASARSAPPAQTLRAPVTRSLPAPLKPVAASASARPARSPAASGAAEGEWESF